MPTIAFTGKGASTARVFVATFTGEIDVTAFTDIAHAVKKKSFERVGVVKRGGQSYMIVIMCKACPLWNFKRTLENNFDAEKYNFSSWEAMDAFHLSQLNWEVPQPEETFAQFARASDPQTQKIVVPALRALTDEEIATYGAEFMRDVVAEHLSMRALQDCQHNAMTRYDSQSHSPMLYDDGVLVKRACSSCHCEMEAHRACGDCLRVWCISCGAAEQTRATNWDFAREVAKRLKRGQLPQVETGEWWPRSNNFVIEVVRKDKMRAERKLQFILHIAPHLEDGQPSIEGSLLNFYKAYFELFRQCHTSKYQCLHNARELFEQWSGLKVGLLGELGSNLKAELEGLRDNTEVLYCRCGNCITDGEELCKECRPQPGKCLLCKKPKDAVPLKFQRDPLHLSKTSGACNACINRSLLRVFSEAFCGEQPQAKRARVC